MLCIMQFPWHWEFFFCLFLQGSWSSFQLKKRNLLAGQGWLKAKWELNNPRKWSLWKKNTTCMQEICFFYWMPQAHHWCWNLLNIHFCPAHWAIISLSLESFFLFTLEDPWSSGSCCFCICWAVRNPSNSFIRIKCEDLWICSFMES